jgi:hypothetical protein
MLRGATLSRYGAVFTAIIEANHELVKSAPFVVVDGRNDDLPRGVVQGRRIQDENLSLRQDQRRADV